MDNLVNFLSLIAVADSVGDVKKRFQEIVKTLVGTRGMAEALEGWYMEKINNFTEEQLENAVCEKFEKCITDMLEEFKQSQQQSM